MGKYSHLKLEKFQEEPKYQQRVDERKGKYTNCNIGQLAGEFDKARREKKTLEFELKDVNLTIAALEQILIKTLESQSLTQTRHERAGLLGIRDKPYTSIIDQPAMVQWAKTTGRESLLTVNYQTMSGIVNQMLTDGLAPPTFVKVYMKQSIGQTGAQKDPGEKDDDESAF